jgi:acyl-CoA dehydrogenase
MEKSTSSDFNEILSKVKNFVKNDLEPLELQVEMNDYIPDEIVSKMRELDLFGLSIPVKYGGLGLSTYEEVVIYEELTQTNACYRSKIGTSNSIGSPVFAS